MDIGQNMARLRDSEVGGSLRACVLAGPADLLVWEIRVTCDADWLPVEVVGRGPDLELAAAEALRQLTTHSLTTLGQQEVGRTE